MNHKQIGFSLIELMVAITISMIMLAGILQVFLNSRNFYNLEVGSAQLQENARFTDLYMSHVIRLAGYRSPPAASVFPTVATTFTGATAYVTGTSGSGINNSDSITVRYQGSGNGTGTPDGTVRDCLNQGIDANTIATSTFSLTNNSELQCQAINPNAAPSTNTQILLSGVEDFKVLYGEDVNNDNSADRYVPANFATLNWNNVVSVRLSILFRSDNQVTLNALTPTYNLLGQTYTPPVDNYVRQQINFTILLRNLVVTTS
jgi:type IV pilus assembly protein PilW